MVWKLIIGVYRYPVVRPGTSLVATQHHVKITIAPFCRADTTWPWRAPGRTQITFKHQIKTVTIKNKGINKRESHYDIALVINMAGRRKWIFHIAIMLNTTIFPLEPREAYGPFSINLHQGPGLSLTFPKDP